jgi:hypothetical protein
MASTTTDTTQGTTKQGQSAVTTQGSQDVKAQGNYEQIGSDWRVLPMTDGSVRFYNPALQELCTQYERGTIDPANFMKAFVQHKHDFALTIPAEKWQQIAASVPNVPGSGVTQSSARFQGSSTLNDAGSRELVGSGTGSGTVGTTSRGGSTNSS